MTPANGICDRKNSPDLPLTTTTRRTRGTRRWMASPASGTRRARAGSSTISEMVPSKSLTTSRPCGGTASKRCLINLATASESIAAWSSRYLRRLVVGEVQVRHEDGTVETLPRATLCRCGSSEHKPFCDNHHLAIGFRAPGAPFKIHLSAVRPHLQQPITKAEDPRRLS